MLIKNISLSRNNLNFIPVTHTLSRDKKVIDEVFNSKALGHKSFFLLEFDDEKSGRYRFNPDKNEFSYLIRKINESGIKYEFIDEISSESYDEFLRDTSIFQMLLLDFSLVFGRLSREHLKKKFPAFYENLIRKREEWMVSRIIEESHRKKGYEIFIVIGEYHIEHIISALRDKSGYKKAKR